MNPKTTTPVRLRRSRKILGVPDRQPGGVGPDVQDGMQDGALESCPASDANYTVGYGRPPTHTRFKPGKSGNPRGRSPQSRNLKTIVKQVLDEPTPVRKDGRIRQMAAIEALVRTTLSRAFKGDLKAFALLFAVIKHSGYGAEAVGSTQDILPGEDLNAILNEYLARFTREDSIDTEPSPDNSAGAADPSKPGEVR